VVDTLGAYAELIKVAKEKGSRPPCCEPGSPANSFRQKISGTVLVRWGRTGSIVWPVGPHPDAEGEPVGRVDQGGGRHVVTSTDGPAHFAPSPRLFHRRWPFIVVGACLAEEHH
jgi:hypothetical protein